MSEVNESIIDDKQVENVMKACGKLALQLGRLVPRASEEDKASLSCAISLCSTAVSVAMVDTQLARTLYSQARRLSAPTKKRI